MNGHSHVTFTHERAANDLRNCLENYETFSGRSHTSARAGLALASLTAHLLTQHVTPKYNCSKLGFISDTLLQTGRVTALDMTQGTTCLTVYILLI